MPVFTAAQLRWLRELPKPVPNDWKVRVWPKDPGPSSANEEARLHLVVPGLPLGASMDLYSRSSKSDPGNYSCGLVYDIGAGGRYHLVRCNGPHARHVNRLEGTVVPADTPHVHYVRMAYLRAIERGEKAKPDGWAIRACYRGLDGALEALARRVHLAYEPNLFDARMLLP